MEDANRTGGGNTGLAGTDSERRRARELADRLRALGRDATVEPIRVRPAFAVAHLIHAIAGVMASVLAVYEPLPGLVALALVTASAFAELTAAVPLARLLTGARASQNVVSEEDDDKPGLLVLVAHYDSPRRGLLVERRQLRRWPALLFWSLVVITVCAIARVLGMEGTWLTVIQFIPTVVLIALSPLFVDVAISGPRVHGPPDPGSGVDEVLRLTDSFGGRLEHFDLMTIFTGASAHTAYGMRAWLRRHRKELDPESTAVVVLDSGESERYVEKEGPVFATRLHPTLIDLCGEDAEPYTARELTDAYVARAAGLPAIRVTGYELAAALVKRIDEEIGPRLS